MSEPTLEQVLLSALRSLASARESLPLTEVVAIRDVVMREVVSAELSVSRALQLIGAGK
jgi:hypothetical protein